MSDRQRFHKSESEEGTMQVIHARVVGLDVHKKSVVACRMQTRPNGRKTQETRTFGTTTAQLLQLLDWIQAWQCTHVAMESTGEYWKPIYNILEGHLEILLVNAYHVKHVAGRKTDVQDAEWLADLLRHGLLRGSFIPPKPQRDLRDLTRQRSTLIRERASVINRLQKPLESANIKLASVISDVTGVSGRAMLDALVDGIVAPAVLAEFAQKRMRQKIDQLVEALDGRLREHHRFLLARYLEHLDFLDQQIAQFDAQIDQHLAQMSTSPDTVGNDVPGSSPGAGTSDEAAEDASVSSDAVSPVAGTNGIAPGHRLAGTTSSMEASIGVRTLAGEVTSASLTPQDAVVLLDTIPGVNQRLAEVLVAEIGIDMQRFPSANHLASWSGVAPGNNESAGKQRSGRTRPGNPALRKALAQAAHGAARQKGSYFQALYRRLAGRRGRKRALVAVAHAIVIAIYYMLTRQEAYRDPGENYFDERKRESVVNRLVHRLEKLGYTVALENQCAAAEVASDSHDPLLDNEEPDTEEIACPADGQSI
jgi:transposase